jgi:hypothetical protein
MLSIKKIEYSTSWNRIETNQQIAKRMTIDVNYGKALQSLIVRLFCGNIEVFHACYFSRELTEPAYISQEACIHAHEVNAGQLYRLSSFFAHCPIQPDA